MNHRSRILWVTLIILALFLAACDYDPTFNPEARCAEACADADLTFDHYGGPSDCWGTGPTGISINIWKGVP